MMGGEDMDYIVESALLTHGIKDLSEDVFRHYWGDDPSKIVWVEKGKLIMLENLVASLMEKFGLNEYEVLKTFKGRELEGVVCRQVLCARGNQCGCHSRDRRILSGIVGGQRKTPLDERGRPAGCGDAYKSR